MKDNNDLLSDKQFGFIKGRSTVLQLLKVLDSWTKTLENGGCIDVVYCDFMKAFDKVPHCRFIGKLQSYGIKGKILDWVAAMLSHSSQLVRVNNSFSSWQEVTSGIPQGSVIGPLIFVIFINDLPEVINSSELLLFADDMKLLYAIYTEEDCTSLQQDLILAEHWTNTSLLKFHPNKCSHMRIGLSSITNDGYTLGPEHITLTSTDKVKDIEVTFDSSLNFDVRKNK